MGPLEVLVIDCPGDRLSGQIALTLMSAVDSGMLQIMDVKFLHRNARGIVATYELPDSERHEPLPYYLTGENSRLLSVTDVEQLGERVSPDSSAVLTVIEHVRSTQIEEAILAGSGQIVMHERVPPDVAIAVFEAGCSPRALIPNLHTLFIRWLDR
jgi:hypothetical protein